MAKSERSNRDMDGDSTLGNASRGTSFRRAAPQLVRWTVRLLVGVVVLAGIARSLQLAWIDIQDTQAKVEKRVGELGRQIAAEANWDRRHELETERSSVANTRMQWEKFRMEWLLISCLAGFFSILMPGILWWLVLCSFHSPPPFLATQAAYSMGTLGKYVPGKAMVLILRSAGMRRWGVPVSVSVTGVVVETLVSLSTAGTLGAISLSTSNQPTWLLQVSIASGILSAIPVIPPIFNDLVARIVHRKQLTNDSNATRTSPTRPKQALIGWTRMLQCWCLMALGWLLMGTSLFAAVAGVSPRILPQGFDGIASDSMWAVVHLWVLCVATASLAFIIGFLSMLPGGAGVREVIVTLLLAPIVGYAPALAAAVFYRLSNLASELSMAGLTAIAARDTKPRLD